MNSIPDSQHPRKPLEPQHADQVGPVRFLESRLSKPLYVITRCLLGGVFLVSGILKLSAPWQFARIIEAYGLIIPQLIFPAAVGLSVLEIVAGLGLVLDVRYALAVIAGLLIFFIIILGYGWFLGLGVDCGCFGSEDPAGKAFHSLKPALYRDLVLLAGAGFLYYWRHQTGFSPKPLCHCFSAQIEEDLSK